MNRNYVIKYLVGGKTVTSNIITLNIKEPLVITVQPKSASSKQNAIIKTTVKASGDSLSYQWYICTAKGKTFSKSSITKATYSCKMTEKSNGRKAYCVITDQYGNTVKTQTVTLHMK